MINDYEDPYNMYKKEGPVPPASLVIPEIKVATPETTTAENEYCYVDPHTINIQTPQSDSDSNSSHAVLRRRHMSYLVPCRRLTCAKSIVADPPSARKEEVVKARCKLQPTNTSVQV